MSDTNPPGGGFGDWEPDDSFDTAEVDAEQFARKLHAFRRLEGLEYSEWEELTPSERVLRIAIIMRIIDWLRVSGNLR